MAARTALSRLEDGQLAVHSSMHQLHTLAAAQAAVCSTSTRTAAHEAYPVPPLIPVISPPFWLPFPFPAQQNATLRLLNLCWLSTLILRLHTAFVGL